jgi:hypothetical protein
MINASKIRVCGTTAGVAFVLFVCLLAVARAQKTQDFGPRDEITVSAGDRSAAGEAGLARVHALAPPHIPGAKEKLAAIHRERNTLPPRSAKPAISTSPTSDALTGPVFNPGDVTSGGGPTLQSTVQHAIYVNPAGSIASGWGNPEGFLRHLNESTFIHLVDQYVGSTENERYPVGRHAKILYGTPGATLFESDIVAIVHAVALEYGSGGSDVYHVFLPQGTDTCFDPTPQSGNPSCYSPDNPLTFTFCAYHAAALFNDIGIVLFSVEPWQGPGSGCSIGSPAPNGVLVDSTDNLLSHETFEMITDPIPGLGFWNQTNLITLGSEIGDECLQIDLSLGAYTPPTFAIDEKNYAVQTEYSNTYHTCATVP